MDSRAVNGLKGWFVWSAPAVSGFAEDPTSLARDNIVADHTFIRLLACQMPQSQSVSYGYTGPNLDNPESDSWYHPALKFGGRSIDLNRTTTCQGQSFF